MQTSNYLNFIGKKKKHSSRNMLPFLEAGKNLAFATFI